MATILLLSVAWTSPSVTHRRIATTTMSTLGAATRVRHDTPSTSWHEVKGATAEALQAWHRHDVYLGFTIIFRLFSWWKVNCGVYIFAWKTHFLKCARRHWYFGYICSYIYIQWYRFIDIGLATPGAVYSWKYQQLRNAQQCILFVSWKYCKANSLVIVFASSASSWHCVCKTLTSCFVKKKKRNV